MMPPTRSLIEARDAVVGRPTAWQPPAMTVPAPPRRGFWYQAFRPIRATGRGIARAADAIDVISLVVHVGRGVVWLVRGTGRLLASVFDW